MHRALWLVCKCCTEQCIMYELWIAEVNRKTFVHWTLNYSKFPTKLLEKGVDSIGFVFKKTKSVEKNDFVRRWIKNLHQMVVLNRTYLYSCTLDNQHALRLVINLLELKIQLDENRMSSRIKTCDTHSKWWFSFEYRSRSRIEWTASERAPAIFWIFCVQFSETIWKVNVAAVFVYGLLSFVTFQSQCLSPRKRVYLAYALGAKNKQIKQANQNIFWNVLLGIHTISKLAEHTISVKWNTLSGGTSKR